MFGPHEMNRQDCLRPDAEDPDTDFAPGYSFGGLPPRAKVRLPDDVKKLRKCTRGRRHAEMTEGE